MQKEMMCKKVNLEIRLFLVQEYLFLTAAQKCRGNILPLNISSPLFSIKVPNPISYRSQGEYLIQAADVHFLVELW